MTEESTQPSLISKIATEDWEFEAIHRLNYKTFVEEIPQHPATPSRRLVDKFHDTNTYVICLNERRLVGMLAMRGRRPFSLDQKLSDLESYLPAGRKIMEVRLLSVETPYRIGRVFRELLQFVVTHGRDLGYDLAIISGTTRQERLYRNLGFVPFGPMHGSGEAVYQPMYLTLEVIEERLRTVFTHLFSLEGSETTPVSFLPGPVEVTAKVRDAFHSVPVSHRSRALRSKLLSVGRYLSTLVHAPRVEILLGSGSLANDVVAGQLSLLEGGGLILSQGEFGERLLDHATRFGLEHDALRLDWEESFDTERLRTWVKRHPEAKWLWAVHCETSTGVLNDLDTLKRLAVDGDMRLCLDCISSVGTVPVDLEGVYLASCVSGKGLRAYPGLSMVFYHHDVQPEPERLPRYLDLGFCAVQDGTPFTHSSNLLEALHASLRETDWEERFSELKDLSASLRGRLQGMGYRIIADGARTSPAVVTVALPKGVSSRTVGWRLKKAGLFLSYQSEYLLARNWIQICLMGELSEEKLEPLLGHLDDSGGGARNQTAR